MFLKGLFAVVGLLGGFLIYVAVSPSQMKISRELLINAKPEQIFPYINNSKKADAWMPWHEIDPKVQMSFAGPEEGVGSVSSWTSEGQMGVGSATVVESQINQFVRTKLEYTKPMTMKQLAEVSLHPQGDLTSVRWAVEGENSFVGRLMCKFIDMDKVVGGNFETGLQKLKAQVEASIAPVKN